MRLEVDITGKTFRSAAGGTHEDWDEFDRVMAAEGRAVVLVTPTRSYSNAS